MMNKMGVLFILFVFCSSQVIFPQSKVAARINDEIIMWDDVEAQLKKLKPYGDVEMAKKELLKAMVIEKIFLLEAKELNIEVTESEIDKEIQKEQKQTGKNFIEYREQKRKEILIQKVVLLKLQKIGGTNPYTLFVAPEEIRRYYKEHIEEFTASQKAIIQRIVLTYNSMEERQYKLALASSLVNRIKKGTSFPAVAYYYSDVSEEEKGAHLIGMFLQIVKDKSQLPREIQEIIFNHTTQGEIKAFDTGNAIIIIKLESKIEVKEKPFEIAQVEIRKILERRKLIEAQNEILKDLISKYYISPASLQEELLNQ